jgi:hypothetical protein
MELRLVSGSRQQTVLPKVWIVSWKIMSLQRMDDSLNGPWQCYVVTSGLVMGSARSSTFVRSFVRGTL